MGKLKYYEEEQKTVNVLKYQDNQLDELMKDSSERRNKTDAEIEFLESQLSSLGVNPNDIKPLSNPCVPKKVMVYP